MEDEILSDAVSTGEDLARRAAINQGPEELAELGPTVATVDPDLAAAETTSSEEISALSLEQDPTDLSASFTPDTELPDGQRPMETQEVPPKAIIDPASKDEVEQSPRKASAQS